MSDVKTLSSTLLELEVSDEETEMIERSLATKGSTQSREFKLKMGEWSS
jgi:hypothetical protein